MKLALLNYALHFDNHKLTIFDIEFIRKNKFYQDINKLIEYYNYFVQKKTFFLINECPLPKYSDCKVYSTRIFRHVNS